MAGVGVWVRGWGRVWVWVECWDCSWRERKEMVPESVWSQGFQTTQSSNKASYLHPGSISTHPMSSHLLLTVPWPTTNLFKLGKRGVGFASSGIGSVGKWALGLPGEFSLGRFLSDVPHRTDTYSTALRPTGSRNQLKSLLGTYFNYWDSRSRGTWMRSHPHSSTPNETGGVFNTVCVSGWPTSQNQTQTKNESEVCLAWLVSCVWRHSSCGSEHTYEHFASPHQRTQPRMLQCTFECAMSQHFYCTH